MAGLWWWWWGWWRFGGVTGSGAKTYPVNLIKIVRLQNDRTDDTSARSSLHLDFEVAEEGVELGVHGRGISVLVDGELSTIIAVLDESVSSTLPALVALGEISLEGVCVQANIGRAGGCNRISGTLSIQVTLIRSIQFSVGLQSEISWAEAKGAAAERRAMAARAYEV